jgi:hypothetical protein
MWGHLHVAGLHAAFTHSSSHGSSIWVAIADYRLVEQMLCVALKKLSFQE